VLGLAEMRRLSRRQVVVTWEPAVFAQRFWLVRDYLRQEASREEFAGQRIADELGGDVGTIVLPVSHDCTDGVFGAYWRRPEARLACRRTKIVRRQDRGGVDSAD